MDERCKNCNQIVKRDAIIDHQRSDFLSVLNESRDIFYRYNFENSSYDYLTGNVEQITGYSSQELKDNGVNILLESLHPGDKDHIIPIFEGLANNTVEDSELRLEYRTRHKEGHYVHRSDHLRIIRNTEGKITAVVGSNRNITHQRQAEQKCRASQERYKRLAQAAFEGIVIHKDGVPVDVNQQFCDMLGYSEEELQTINGLDTVRPECRETVRQYFETGYEGPYEIYVKRKDGSEIPMEVRARNIQIDGQALRIATFRDMTEQKKLQQQLAQSEKRYRELYNNAHVALFRTGLDGTLLDCNKATLSFFGYSLDETGFLGNYSVIDAYVDKNRRQAFIELLRKNKFVRNFETQLYHQSGTRFWASIDAELFAEEGYIEGALYNISIEKLLTKTEKEILRLVLMGKTNKEIATETNRSIRTIEDHRSHIMQKLGANNLVDLTQKAITLGFKP